MVEITNELMSQLANEEVVGIELGGSFSNPIIGMDAEAGYSNRIRMTTESGYIIVADVLSIQTPEERLEELDRRIAVKGWELAELEAERETVAGAGEKGEEEV